MRRACALSCGFTSETLTPADALFIVSRRAHFKRKGDLMSWTLDTRDAASPVLNAIHDRVRPGRRAALMGILGRTGEKALRSWFLLRDQNSPNKKGWQRKHFWSRIRRATAYVPGATTDSTAQVSISDPAFRMKVRGGEIVPRDAKALAIPTNEEAYTAGYPRSGLISGLVFIPAKAGSNAVGYLGRHEAGGAVTIYYRLVRKVTITADRAALPDRAEVGLQLSRAAERFVAKGENVK